MSFSADELEDGARAATGLDDFGSPYYREGLERTVDALNNEADLNEMGNVIQHATISNALIQRLKIIDTYKQHPEIADEVVDGPVVILGLPRTGTTALGQLVANDPQFRSLRTWESQAPTPPPEAATQHTDPRIAQAAEGIAMIDSMFPDFKTMMQLGARGRDRMPGPDGHELSDLPLRRRGPGSQLHRVADGDRYARDLRVSPAGAQTAAVALQAEPVAPAHAGAHVRPRRLRRGVSERQIPVEPSRSGEGAGFGVQPDLLRPQLEQ